MKVQHNIPAMNSYRNYASNQGAIAKNLEKLSSGYRINRAGDDAAGLAISEKMRAQITGLKTAQKNSKDGISLIQTAEGALTEVHSMLNRMFDLSEQSANGTFDNETDRANLQKEFDALRSEIDRIADSSNFNGKKLLDGSMGGGSVSANGATFKGAEVAKYEVAKSAALTVPDFSGTAATTGNKETLTIDGQQLTIDWSKGDAKKFIEANGSTDFPTALSTVDGTKDFASKLQDLINNEMKDQGLSGSVKVSSSAAGAITIESTSKSANSSIGYIGGDDSAPEEGFFGQLFGTTAGESVVVNGTQKYNGETLAANSDMNMTINGVTVNVKLASAVTKGDDMEASGKTADTLATAIKAAVDDYNKALGLSTTGGTLDTVSGLTSLNKADFSVEVKDGSLVVKYGGDENISFSFSDIGDKTTASSLGLANGSSKSGGAGGLTLQIGDTSDSFNMLNVSVDDMHCRSLGIDASKINIAQQGQAQTAMDAIKTAINSVSSTRGDLGALQNRLEHTISNLGVMQENIQDAEANIRDTDVAQEMMQYTKNNILIQSSQAMLAQANQLPQGVLQLLG